VESYAALYDVELVAVEVDAGESAKSLQRPALDRTLATLRAGAAEALLVVKLDRLTRSVRDLCDLVDTYFRDGKLALMSVGEQVDTRSVAGRMVLNMLTVIGQWEREAIGLRRQTRTTASPSARSRSVNCRLSTTTSARYKTPSPLG
jgi:DNA invertase Pin-like site-specific DNA recombinase